MNTSVDRSGRPVIVGGGIAGMMTALHLAPRPVVLISRAPLQQEASSVMAQGGVAASLGADDSPSLHLADTLAAGDGLCDPHVVDSIVRAAPAEVEALARFGVRFDRDAEGALLLGLEAAHSRHRIVHAGGDGTGREIVRALAAAVRATPGITVLEGMDARRVLVEDGAVAGVVAAGPSGPVTFASGSVVIATGGVGGLFADTTNPLGSFGQGLALAAGAGAVMRDLEFVQYHPTAFDGPMRPMPLVSEAVRGEGAVLVDETGARFLAHLPGAELAPRDVVARAVWKHLAAGHAVFLDARSAPGAKFAARFPAIHAFCVAAGIDPAIRPIPIRPAVHYHMGGIEVDGEGRSTLAGLWACGEAASTGLHGANRLASNSLIEAVVCARRVAESIGGEPAEPKKGAVSRAECPRPDPAPVRSILSPALGVLRNEADLCRAVSALLRLAERPGAARAPAVAGLMMAVAAFDRSESRGAHSRIDFPSKAPAGAHSRLTFAESLDRARDIAGHDLTLAF